ncbi:hypothetical protein BEN71_00955 [Acinetobacter wuhouensis]|uniref:Uncharacterized protein n=1 Tax=Acinetobacter wuhouensis TaxID=1879050 RepID=A0A385BZA7_9GAMM|nr:hypothetical protein [Acinetobacter wuhouensis]AXQ20747.1 hypothetical protein BEN71_00955 [Acinetobacter wuhouensis]RZG48470.1 hypothetical protein EXU28_03890 [Acinetobacter wuhouensis]RZG74659.1 hypothetical protein EXU29_04530 [Acinetobacter wuhouensis]
MHSNKIAFALIMGMMATTTWAASAPEVQPTTATQPAATPTSTSEPQPEVRVEDIDAPILE